MARRTTETVVRFAKPFRLPGFDELQPAGEYRVDHDEETLETITRLAWHRVGSFIHLPRIGAAGPTQQMVPIGTAELEAALATDRRTS